MAGRPKKTPANPGRASIDIGAIAGAFGAGGGGIEEVPMEGGASMESEVPMEGDVDAKMASSNPARQPLTTLRAKKPGFVDIIATRGQAGIAYRELDAKLKMQELQNRFLAGQATQADLAAMDRVREQARLQVEGQVGAEQRARGYAAEDRTRKSGAMNVALNEVNLARMRQGLPPIDRVSDFEGAQIAFGEGNINQRGVVPALTTLIPEGLEAMIRGNQAQSILDYQASRPDQAGLAYGAELQSTIDKPGLTQRGMGLGERQQTETERSNLSREMLAGKQLDFNMSQPIFGQGLAAFPKVGMSYDMYGVTPGQDAQNVIETDPVTGQHRVVNKPATRTSIAPLSISGSPSRAVFMKVDPAAKAAVTGGNPAPQNAAPLSTPLSSTQQPVINRGLTVLNNLGETAEQEALRIRREELLKRRQQGGLR